MKALLAPCAFALLVTGCATQPEAAATPSYEREFRTGSNIGREKASVSRVVVDSREQFERDRDYITPATTVKTGN